MVGMKKILIGVAVVIVGLVAWLQLRPVAILAEEDWALDVPADAPVPALASPDLQALVDRLAGTDVMDAAIAWNKIGASYRTDASYLADLGPALRDPRPVHFEMVKESTTNGGYTFIYYQVKTPSYSGKGVPAYAHTVGQALCYFLWQYQDASNQGYSGSTFKAWWAGYAPMKALPLPR